MHFKQIEALVCVIKNGSFTKAAEEMFLSQSTISVHINSLEDELGCQLIIRTPKGVFASEAGEIFYRYALQILRLRECAEGAVTQYKGNLSGNLILSASTVPSSYILPKILPEFIRAYPKIKISIIDNDSGKVSKLVENMEVEIGITGYNNLNANCNFEAFCPDKLTIITPNTPEYRALNGKMTIEMLKSSFFVIRESDSGTQKQSFSFLDSMGIKPHEIKISLQLQNTESVAQAVKHGAGIGIVSKIAVLDKIERGEILSFDIENEMLNRYFYIVTHRYIPLTPLAETFRKFLINSFQNNI